MSGDNFWTTADDRHQEIARKFYENIEFAYPDSVTSRGMCPCLEYSYWCGHPMEGKAEYIEYNGPRVTNL